VRPDRAGPLATVGMIAGSACTCWTVILATLGVIGWRIFGESLTAWLSWTAMCDPGERPVTGRIGIVVLLGLVAALTLPHLSP
jgi:hypothetical protein